MEITEITGPMFAAHKLLEELEEAADMCGADLRFEHQGPVDAGKCFITVILNGEDEYIHTNTDAIFAYLAGLEKGAYLSTHATETKIPGSANWKTASPEEILEQICETEKTISKEEADKLYQESVHSLEKWINWNGGDMPTRRHAFVQIITRSGQSNKGYAKDFRWDHTENEDLYMHNTDIVKYMVISP